jgi:hypothetical protein
VFSAESGLGSVFVTESYRPDVGCLLAESLFRKVNTSAPSSTTKQSLRVRECTLHHDGYIGTDPNYYTAKHEPITLASPNNDSPAIKAQEIQVVRNGKLYNGWIWNEIKHNGVDWGDDGTIKVGVDSYTNLNGEVCLAGINIDSKPYGYVHNHARAGKQQKGVDL